MSSNAAGRVTVEQEYPSFIEKPVFIFEGTTLQATLELHVQQQCDQTQSSTVSYRVQYLLPIIC
jgi:hypothetical protein